jgi:spore coat polysaccharide biosynthesis protein SpsF
MAAGDLGNLMKVIGILQARIDSSRLPNKIVLPLFENSPLIAIQSQRLAKSGIEWWLATTAKKSDDLTSAWAESLGFKVFRGSEDDVLSRFQEIQKMTHADWIVRATGDDPLMNSEMTLKLISAAKSVKESTDLICDTPINRQFPLGFCPEIVRGKSLLKITALNKPIQSYHKAHVTSYFLEKSSSALVAPELPNRANWRWTVDTNIDLDMMKKLFNVIGKNWIDQKYADTVECLDLYPEIYKLNLKEKQKKIQEG